MVRGWIRTEHAGRDCSVNGLAGCQGHAPIAGGVWSSLGVGFSYLGPQGPRGCSCRGRCSRGRHGRAAARESGRINPRRPSPPPLFFFLRVLAKVVFPTSYQYCSRPVSLRPVLVQRPFRHGFQREGFGHRGCCGPRRRRTGCYVQCGQGRLGEALFFSLSFSCLATPFATIGWKIVC